MALTARTQALLHYRRRRVRSLRALPELHQSRSVLQGAQQADPFTAGDLARAITFKTVLDLSRTGPAFSLGSSLTVTQSSGLVSATWRGESILSASVPDTGSMLFVLSLLPGTCQSRAWNQRGEMGRAQITTDPVFTTFADVGDAISADASLLDPLRVFEFQLPHHFHPILERQGPSPAIDNLLFNVSAFKFVPGWPTPLFEG